VRIGVVLVSVAQADVGEAPRSSPNTRGAAHGRHCAPLR